MEQNLAAIFANAPGGDHGLTRLTRVQPLGNSIDIEVDTNYTLTPALASSKSATSVVRRVPRWPRTDRTRKLPRRTGSRNKPEQPDIGSGFKYVPFKEGPLP